MSIEGRPAPAAPAGDLALELCVVVPTFNERDNVRPLVHELAAALEGIAWEVIFVDDDSPDGTARAVREIDIHRPRVRCLERSGRRGLLASAHRPLAFREVPYRFRTRRAGVSKVDSAVAWGYLLLLAGKLIGRSRRGR